MTKQSSKKSDEITLPGPVFWGIPLFFGPGDLDSKLDAYRQAGEFIADFANGARKKMETTTGMSDSTEGDQQMVIRWLSKLPKLPPRMLKEIANYAEQIEPRAAEIASKVIKGHIELRAYTYCLPPTSNVSWAFLMASLLSAGHGENFAKCPECGIWFFDVPSGRPMKKFCSQAHANRHRQRKYREKRK